MAGSPAKKPVDLAIVFGGKGGGPRPPRDDPEGDEMGGMGGMGGMGDEEGGGAFDTAADEFLDDTLPIEDRKAALKRAVMACMGEDY